MPWCDNAPGLKPLLPCPCPVIAEASGCPALTIPPITLGLGASVVAALDRVTEVGELVMLLTGVGGIAGEDELDSESIVGGGAVGYRGNVGDPAPLLVPARGLALLDLKLRLAPIPGGICRKTIETGMSSRFFCLDMPW